MNDIVSRTALADQNAAREREFARRAQMVAVVGFLIVAPLVLWAILAVLGYLPAAPWSPMGKQQ